MALLVKVTGYYPPRFCIDCMFRRVSNYSESNCMLNDMRTISSPEIELPDWCPMHNAEEVEDSD